MYTHQILRVEITKSREGADEVFVDVQIYHDTLGVLNWGRWFQGTQAQEIVADDTILPGLIATMVPGIVAQKQLEANNPPAND